MNRRKYKKETEKLKEAFLFFIVGLILFFTQLFFIYVNGPYQGNLISKYKAYLCDSSVYPKGKGIILIPLIGIIFVIVRLVKFVKTKQGKY